jgi:uncharacterized LabA/DUF88 family protein
MNKFSHHKPNFSTNVNIYIDYENLTELLKLYQTNPISINFFPVILDKLMNDYNFKIVDCIAYCNFEKRSLNGSIQTTLQKLGIQTRHSGTGTKNCGDLLLTVDALLALTRYPNINGFVIISSDRDMIPLLNAIKADGKITYLLSTRCGFNKVMAESADYHEYIEDIFHLKLPSEEAEQEYESDIVKAREVSRFLYRSNIWRNHEITGELITLKGYALLIEKMVNRTPFQITKDFEAANLFGYIKIYNDPQKGPCLEKGDNYDRISRRREDEEV